MNIEFEVLRRKTTNNKKKIEGKKEMTNPVRSIAIGM